MQAQDTETCLLATARAPHGTRLFCAVQRVFYGDSEAARQVSGSEPGSEQHSSCSVRLQTLVGVGTVLLALGLGAGAVGISSVAGYGGIGPNFLPWVVSAVLLVCGVLCIWEGCTGGFRHLEPGSGALRGHWDGFAWVSAGLLLDAALITRIGFILACALCFMLAARGFKNAEGRTERGLHVWCKDLAIGVLVAAPVYWMFTKLLDIRLPGLTTSGWL